VLSLSPSQDPVSCLFVLFYWPNCHALLNSWANIHESISQRLETPETPALYTTPQKLKPHLYVGCFFCRLKSGLLAMTAQSVYYSLVSCYVLCCQGLVWGLFCQLFCGPLPVTCLLVTPLPLLLMVLLLVDS
jgi:hypothetical protein